jgi:alkanesulfonate monooxygenase SsuD/methylene tetrahydromethanopterin reductase-like flavin-dependent oxidoreductase (luciferase family)
MGSRASAANFGDIAEYCDGWMPIEYFGKTVELVPRLRKSCEQAGRDPDDIEVSVMLPFVDGSSIDRYVGAGIARLILPLPSAGPDEVRSTLDDYEPLIAAFRELGVDRVAHIRKAGTPPRSLDW